MKTLIIYNEVISPLRYKVIEGDYSRFNGVTVNAVNGNGYENEFCDWMYSAETGEELIKDWSYDVSILESKDWDKVAICTFLP